MKHSNQMNGDQSIHTNHSTTMERIISSGTYEEYVNHILATQAHYGNLAPGMYPPTSYPMTYDPTSFYGLPYDHRTMSTMGVTGYEHSMDPYFGQSGTSMSRARNPVEYEQQIDAFLRHTNASSSYSNSESSNKAHRSHRRHRDEKDYHEKSSSRHRSRSREHRH